MQYKQNVEVTEERFDFIVPAQGAQVMTRDLQSKNFNTSQTYWSDIYTPKVVKFTNGLSFSGSDTMEAMRLRTSGANSQISFYSDFKNNHPHTNYVKNGGRAEVDMSKTKRLTGDSYSVSITFMVNPNFISSSLIKTRQPYGYESTLIFTNHADSETIPAAEAIAYGTADSTDPNYGSKGIVGRGVGWTKSVFVSGQTGSDLQDAVFKSLTDRMYRDGVEIVGHSITPGTDGRNIVLNGLQTLSQYNTTNWIDYGSGDGVGNWEVLVSQGAIKGDAIDNEN